MAGEQPKKLVGGALGQYMAEMRPALQKECTGKPAVAVTKLGSERFKALSEAEKAVYQKKYEKAKAKYDADLKAFLDAGGEKKAIVKKRKGDAKPAKDPDRPKKPAGGAFGCFLAAKRPEFQKQTEGQPVTAVAKLASTKWAALTEKEKKPYEEAYAKKKKEYEEAMKSYVPLVTDDADEKPAKKPRVSKEEKEAAKEQKEAHKKGKAEAKAAAKGKAKAKAAAK